MDTLLENTLPIEESMVVDLVPETHPLLTQKLEKFNFQSEHNPTEIANILAQTLLTHQGLGLSCNQIGLPHRACIIKSSPMICMFNPYIVSHSEELIRMDEGCLSFPNLILKIKRPMVIRVRYTEPNGITTTKTFEGLTARVIQHEIDHLDGIIFTSRASRIHRENGNKKRQKINRSRKK